MVKVFTTNTSGKIEFTKEELEKLLNEIWNDGYAAHHETYWWTSPTSITPSSICSTGDIKITCDGKENR